MVAVSVPINRLSSVSYAPRPGDHVNVIVSLLLVDVDTDFQAITPNLSGVVTASGPPDPGIRRTQPTDCGDLQWCLWESHHRSRSGPGGFPWTQRSTATEDGHSYAAAGCSGLASR